MNNINLNSTSIRYEPHIDGLRAIAVLAVVFYHLFPRVLPSGFVGVDIFFVISGYLISRIIFQSLVDNNFNFTDFYIRRIKRIFPALITILFFVCIAGWIILLDFEYVALGKMVRSTTTFLTNLRLFKEVGYFDSAAVEKPLLHIWSLSMEEQFYLYFPLVIFVFYKIKRWLLPLLVLLILASFSRNLVLIQTDQPASFYFLSSRAWELFLGAMLAYYKVFPASSTNQKLNSYNAILAKPVAQNFFAFLGLGMVVYAAIMFKEPKLFPGWLALFPAVGTLLLLSARNTWVSHQLLSSRILVWIGLISYSLYLWHWPLFSFATILNKGKLSTLTLSMILLSSFILAALTTFYLEKPIRRLGYKIIYVLVPAMFAMLLFSFMMTSERLTPLVYKTTPSVQRIQLAVKDWHFGENKLTATDMRNIPFPSYGNGKKIALFFGDSNIEQYWPRVEKLMQEHRQIMKDFTAVFATFPGQIPILDAQKDIDEKNGKFIKKVSDYFSDPSIDSVIIGSCWILYLLEDTQATETYYAKLEEMLDKLREQGKTTYLILNIPTGPQYDPIGMINRHLLSEWEFSTQKTHDSAEWLTRSHKMTARLKAIADATDTIIIDPIDALCPKGKCLLLDENNTPIYKDATHLTGTYAREHATYIDPIFN